MLAARRRGRGRDLHRPCAAPRRRRAHRRPRCATSTRGPAPGAHGRRRRGRRRRGLPGARRSVPARARGRRRGRRPAGARAARRHARRSAPQGPGIVCAEELTPGEAVGLDPGEAWGIATARGGATAHAAILARALGIPAVVGVGDALLGIAEGTPLILDGEAGTHRRRPRRGRGRRAGGAPQGRRRGAARAARAGRGARGPARRPSRRGLRQRRQPRGGARRRRAGRRGHRPPAHRVPVPGSRDAAGRGRAGRGAERDRRARSTAVR